MVSRAFVATAGVGAVLLLVTVAPPITPTAVAVVPRRPRVTAAGAALNSPTAPPPSKPQAPAARGHGIPRIVHQTWKSHNLYPAQAQWRENCRRLNPGWEFRLYDDDENLALVREHFPELEETYMSYPKNINRIDAVRLLYLAKFGGVYMDLDYTCLRPFDELLAGADMVMAQDAHMAGKDGHCPTCSELLPVGNSFMSSAAGHEIALNATRRLKQVRRIVRDETGHLAGVWFIRQLLEPFRPRFGELRVRIAPMEAVSPLQWTEGGAAETAAKSCTAYDDVITKCREKFPKAFTISFWTGTWVESKGIKRLSWDVKRQTMLGLRKSLPRDANGTIRWRDNTSIEELEKRVGV